MNMSSSSLGRVSRRFTSSWTIILIALACVLISLCMIDGAAFAEDLDEPQLVEADAAVLMDKGGNVLFEREAYKREHPASTTKVMTAMVVLDSGHALSETVDMVAPDLGENSQMGDYATGDKITLDELLQVMLVYSGNDAAYNAACYVGGSEEAFADLMNEKAAEIGMEHTHFVNSHGLENDDHYSCAYDMALMGRYALEHYPYIARTVLQPTVEAHVYGDVSILNSSDKLLESYVGIRGIKTGAIIDNYTFIGASGRGNTQLYMSVLGCKTYTGRFDDSVALMDWGYAHYQSKSLTKGNWISRVEPYSYDLGMKSVLCTESDFSASTWPTFSKYSYETVVPKSHRLLDTSTTYGWTQWTQSSSDLGDVYYDTRPVPVRVSSWPTFMLPLFEDVENIGKV